MLTWPTSPSTHTSRSPGTRPTASRTSRVSSVTVRIGSWAACDWAGCKVGSAIVVGPIERPARRVGREVAPTKHLGRPYPPDAGNPVLGRGVVTVSGEVLAVRPEQPVDERVVQLRHQLGFALQDQRVIAALDGDNGRRVLGKVAETARVRAALHPEG